MIETLVVLAIGLAFGYALGHADREDRRYTGYVPSGELIRLVRKGKK